MGRGRFHRGARQDMSRNKIDQPHPTPNPDGPHAQDAEAALAARQEAAAHMTRDSGTDEIPLTFASSAFEPDPFLESQPLQQPETDEQSGFAPAAGEAVVPATSEFFQMATPSSTDVTHTDPPLDSPLSAFVIESPDPELIPAVAINLDAPSTPVKSSGHAPPFEPDLDDDAKFPWTTLILLAYSTAITMLLTWLVATGRLGGMISRETPADSQSADADSVEAVTRAPRSPAPPIPKENTVELKGVIRLGDLEATPLAIEADQVLLVRSIGGEESRREDSQSLILRIRFTNRSPAVAFAPVERALLRDQSSRWDRSEITTSDGKRFAMFPLAIDSEWEIEGQKLTRLDPGESMETMVASEPGILDQLGDELTWRLRVRTGLYRSDMLGIRFRRDQVVRRPPPAE